MEKDRFTVNPSPPTAAQILAARCREEEGFSATIYLDHKGNPTVGFGHLVTDPVLLAFYANGGMFLTPQQAESILQDDLAVGLSIVERVFAMRLDPVRRAALAEMAFNMGEGRFRGFKDMIAAVCAEDWEAAAREALDSQWHRVDLKNSPRDEEIAEMLRTGKVA